MSDKTLGSMGSRDLARGLDDLIRFYDHNKRLPFRSEYRAWSEKLSDRFIREEFGSWGQFLVFVMEQIRGVPQGASSKAAEPPSNDFIKDPAAFQKLTHSKKENQKKQMSDAEVSEYIANVMRECSEQMGIPPQSLTWFDFREYIKHAYGNNCAGITPRDITRVGGFNLIRDAYFPPIPTEVYSEKTRLQEYASLNRKLGVEAARYRFQMENLETFAERVFGGKVQPPTPVMGFKDKTERIITAVLSDTHFGSDLLKSETGVLNYGIHEEARRAAFVFQEIADYKIQYRDTTELELLLIWDMIHGTLHDKRDGAVLAEQQARTIHILIQGVSYLSAFFKKIRVRCVTGNHGRNTARHQERATYQKFDSHETIIYYAVKAACRNLPNVEFHIPKTPYATYEVFGKKVITTHGDTMFNPGNPGKSINIKGLEEQINRINASLIDIEEYSVVIVGHVHTGSITYLNNGAVMITNPPLIPPDNFAVSIGIMEGTCGQLIFESVPGYAVGDARIIRVDHKTDQNAELEKIVSPWPGF